MKPRFLTILLGFASASALSGCLGTTLDGTLASVIYDSFDSASGLSTTAASAMPTSGSADYEGGSIITVGGIDDPDHMLVGKTNLSVDFAAASATGSITEIQGKKDATNRDWMTLNHPGVGSVEDYDAVLATFTDANGVINIPSGFLIGNELIGDLNGTVRHGGSVIKTEGSFIGDFKGADAGAIRLYGSTDRTADAMVVTYDGAVAGASMDGAVLKSD